MENQNGEVIVNNEETQNPANEPKKPCFIVRAGRAIYDGYQKVQRTKGGRIVTRLVEGGLLVFSGWKLHEAYGQKDVICVTGGVTETNDDDIPAEEEPIDQPGETGNDETETEA